MEDVEPRSMRKGLDPRRSSRLEVPIASGFGGSEGSSRFSGRSFGLGVLGKTSHMVR